MTTEQMVLTGLTVIVIPLAIADFRYRLGVLRRLGKVEEFQAFLKTYLLKEAVLTFHSNPNPDTDKIIEKVISGEPITADEFKKLEEKIQHAAESADEPKKKLKAANVLELLHRAFEDEFQESTTQRAQARNTLFTE